MCIDLLMKIAFFSSFLLVVGINLYNVLENNKFKKKVKDLSMDLDIHRELVKGKFDRLGEKVDDFHPKFIRIYSTLEDYKEHMAKRLVDIDTSIKANQEDIVTLGEGYKGLIKKKKPSPSFVSQCPEKKPKKV